MSPQSRQAGGSMFLGRYSAAGVIVPELVDFICGEGFTLRALGTPQTDPGSDLWWLLGLEEYDRDIALIGLICDDDGELIGSARVWTPRVLADVVGDAATGMVAAFITANAPHWHLLSSVSAVPGPAPTAAAGATPAVMGLPAHWNHKCAPDTGGFNGIRRQ